MCRTASTCASSCSSSPLSPRRLASMAAEALTEYERRRLENIRRNSEMMASLMVKRKASDLATSLKRSTVDSKKPKKEEKNTKKPRFETPVVLRRSLRHRGLPPEASPALPDDHPQSPPQPDALIPPRKQGPLLIADAFVEGSDSSDRHLLEAILNASDRPTLGIGRGEEGEDSIDPNRDLMLKEENVKKVLEGRILAVRFLPFRDRTVIVGGDKLGHVGFWYVDAKEDDNDGVYLYTPHSGPVSGISVHLLSSTKIFTCSYDGLIRLMDVQNGTFNMIYSSDYLIYSICHSPDNVNSIYFGEGSGELKLWDERTGKISSTWDLHEKRINTIDFNPENVNMMSTSSTDGTACIWDLRKLRKSQPESLKTVQHQRAVHSAYFSPGGICLATTSLDDRVGILSGVNFDNLSMVRHDNQTGRWLSTFRAIWGWDDSHLFIGNMKRAIDVISTDLKMGTQSLVNEYMTSIPCRFAAHPYQRGALAGATAGGKVFFWTKD